MFCVLVWFYKTHDIIITKNVQKKEKTHLIEILNRWMIDWNLCFFIRSLVNTIVSDELLFTDIQGFWYYWKIAMESIYGLEFFSWYFKSYISEDFKKIGFFFWALIDILLIFCTVYQFTKIILSIKAFCQETHSQVSSLKTITKATV